MIDRVKRLFRRRTTIPVVQLSGVIGAAQPTGAQLSLDKVASGLESAFEFSRAPAVAIVVNSPGGAPVQSHLIFRRIRQLAADNKKPVLVFVEDVAASGGYMLACAGDEIIADPASIVGSIGVVSRGFGFVGLLERIGVERRVHTAGGRKAILDPFRPEEGADVAHLEALQHDIHEHFIALVRNRRGAKLAGGEEIFSGLFWTGRKAMELGLVDALGDANTVLRERFGEEIRLKMLRPARPSLVRRLMGWALGSALARAAADLDERALWSRYGL